MLFEQFDLPLLAPSPLTKRSLRLERYGKKGARPKAYLQAALHAGELPGAMVLHHLRPLLRKASEENRITGEILIAPLANPIGLSQFVLGTHIGRFEMGYGRNFNRRWPDLIAGVAERIGKSLSADATRNVAAIREAIGDQLAALIPDSEEASLKLEICRLAYDADIVLDLHCDEDALMHLYLLPELWTTGEVLARYVQSACTLLSPDSGGGSFEDSFSIPWTRLQKMFPNYPIPSACFAATLEYRGELDVNDEMGQKDAIALYHFLQHQRLISGSPPSPPSLLLPPAPLEGVERPAAPIGGIVIHHRQLGEEIQAGDIIAEILDPSGTGSGSRVPVVAKWGGLLFARRLRHWVRAGESIVTLAGRQPIPAEDQILLSD